MRFLLTISITLFLACAGGVVYVNDALNAFSKPKASSRLIAHVWDNCGAVDRLEARVDTMFPSFHVRIWTPSEIKCESSSISLRLNVEGEWQKWMHTNNHAADEATDNIISISKRSFGSFNHFLYYQGGWRVERVKAEIPPNFWKVGFDTESVELMLLFGGPKCVDEDSCKTKVRVSVEYDPRQHVLTGKAPNPEGIGKSFGSVIIWNGKTVFHADAIGTIFAAGSVKLNNVLLETLKRSITIFGSILMGVFLSVALSVLEKYRFSNRSHLNSELPEKSSYLTLKSRLANTSKQKATPGKYRK